MPCCVSKFLFLSSMPQFSIGSRNPRSSWWSNSCWTNILFIYSRPICEWYNCNWTINYYWVNFEIKCVLFFIFYYINLTVRTWNVFCLKFIHITILRLAAIHFLVLSVSNNIRFLGTTFYYLLSYLIIVEIFF